MTIASDKNSQIDRLSDTSRKMLALRDEVFAEWERRIRAAVQQAEPLRHPILINTLPSFYENIAQALTPDYPRANGVQATNIATEHGGERARLTHYDPKAIIVEYQLLRDSMLDVLQCHGVALTDAERQVINASIDEGIREAVTAYVVAVAALREQFMAALTHDLRNPLASARMGAELISRLADSPKIKSAAAMIVENHRRMDGMIHQLLDAMVSHGNARLRLKISSFDILELVQAVQKQLESVHGPRLRITGPSVNVFWSRDEIKRAVENLLGNAIKYGDVNTSITVTIDSIDERVSLSVHNEGNPIAPEEAEDIFQIYQRAHAAKQGQKEGWGIGLPFVRAVVESHGGSILVDSAPGRGTTFTMDIPADARPFQQSPTLE
ncbi:MAG: histidine kinase [Polaromonas sp.]|nr:histidine kinase [Polaromonas sp.]